MPATDEVSMKGFVRQDLMAAFRFFAPAAVVAIEENAGPWTLSVKIDFDGARSSKHATYQVEISPRNGLRRTLTGEYARVTITGPLGRQSEFPMSYFRDYQGACCTDATKNSAVARYLLN